MCTSFRIKTQDSSVGVGRTMEFPNLMAAKVCVLPRGYAGEGIAPSGTGKTWTSQYGVVGIDAFGQSGWMTDGTNEKGVYAGLLYMPGFCDYEPADGKDDSACMSIVNAVAFALGTCATVAEAKAAMASVTVWPWVVKAMGFAPPAHLVLHDASGDSAVCEWRDGAMVIFDNPVGVATNAPHLDWHLTNIRNYVNIAPTDPKPLVVEGVTLPPIGEGQGLTGLPGDSSPPSRFVRATAYVASLVPVATAADLDQAVLHVLNVFDIPLGSIRGAAGTAATDDHTLWSTVSNLADTTYSFRGYTNPNTLRIDLKTTDFTAGPPREVPLPDGDFASLAV